MGMINIPHPVIRLKWSVENPPSLDKQRGIRDELSHDNNRVFPYVRVHPSENLILRFSVDEILST